MHETSRQNIGESSIQKVEERLLKMLSFNKSYKWKKKKKKLEAEKNPSLGFEAKLF